MVNGTGASQDIRNSFSRCMANGGTFSIKAKPDKYDTTGFNLVGVCTPKDQVALSEKGKTSRPGPVGEIWNAVVKAGKAIGEAVVQALTK